MAHQLGGFYNLPHGVCNAMLLPHVEAFNASVSAERLTDIARAMGADVSGLDAAAGAERCLTAIRQLAADVKIPTGLKQLGVHEEDIPLLAANALKDACGLTNPRPASQAEIEAIFRRAM
jgi:alcohol dehydrogenase